MGVKHLWDSNTAIYYLQKLFPPNAELFIDNLLLTEIPVFSVITEIELLCWKTATSKDLQLLQDFIIDSLVIEIEPSIKLKTVELRKNYKIKLPDAVIAATAFIYDLTLLTRNTSDFRNIIGLKLLNPWDQ